MTPFYLERVEDKRAWLEGEEARHCMKVMRKKPGDEIIAIDGKGNMYVSHISNLDKNHVELIIDEIHPNWGEKEQQVILCISPLHKPDRLEWLIEKAVELGVTDIVPYIGKHTVKTGFREDRLQRIIIAALKQSMRSRLPKLHPVIDYEKMIKNLDADLKVIAHAGTGKSFESIENDWKALNSIVLLVGPEGDFAESEIELAIDSEYKTVELGNNRLRSETAAIHLLGICKFLISY